MDKNEQEKEKIVQSFSKKVTPEVALLGQYVPKQLQELLFC